MSIGRGWYEDVTGYPEPDELHDLAVSLLRSKIQECFDRAAKIPIEERLLPKGKI